MKTYSGAIQDFTAAIEISTEFGEAYYNRRNAKYMLNNKSGACTDWRKSVELGIEQVSERLEKFCK